MHVRLRSGRSPHHVVEAEFKALAKALGDACSPTADDVRARRGPVVAVTRIAVLDYGSGNLHSVARALAHAGAEPW